MWSISTVFLLLGLLYNWSVLGNGQTYCSYRNGNFKVDGYNIPQPDPTMQRMLDQHRRLAFQENGTERCDSVRGEPDRTSNSSCYSVWYDDGVKAHLINQGCWLYQEGMESCQSSTCTLRRSTLMKKNYRFCCCLGNMCNRVDDTTPGPVAVQTPTPKVKEHAIINTGGEKKGHKMCAFAVNTHSGKAGVMPDRDGMGEVLSDGQTVKCLKGNYCFTYWAVDPNNKTIITILYQGCWDTSPDAGRTGCNPDVCEPNVHSHNPESLNNSHFCCCSGNMCNNNISNKMSSYPMVTVTTDKSELDFTHLRDPNYKERTILISLLSVVSLAIIILAVYLLYRFCVQSPKPPLDPMLTVEAPLSPGFDVDDLKLSSLLNKGRYSEVWKGSLHEQDVAVKLYSANYRQYYHNEKYIYSLPHMDHEGLLKFYGADERLTQDGTMQYLLVLSYIPLGSLVNYLKNNTIDWFSMCRMCHTLAKALAHLHCDIGSGDNFKPTIAHRDFNSRNILVRPDLGLVIADLGFCMTIQGSKLIHKNHTENAEQSSLTDVGTLRYMAPELLDGAVNLRDCEASLKQIDIYAFGLVMWEIATRCSELYQGAPMPEYALPFKAEAGDHPTFEEMQLLVSRNKTRPKFPEVWKEYNQAVRALKETIEDCWDHDAEARLTALCVEERIIEMNILWTHDSRNKGVTPTINAALGSQGRSGYHGNSGHSNWGGLYSTTESSSPSVVAEGSTTALIINNIYEHNVHEQNVENGSETVANGYPGHRVPSWLQDHSVSTSTTDTTLPITPLDSDHAPPLKADNINAVQNHKVLHPHQGRNPTVERNTHKRSDEELAVSGNNLLYGKERMEADDSLSAPALTSPRDSVLDSFNDTLETSLVQRDVLSQRVNPSIPYVQNQVSTTSNKLPPKMANNPGNGTVSSRTPQQKPKKTKKAKELGIFGHLALLGKLALSGGKAESKESSKKRSDSNLEGGLVERQNGESNSFDMTQQAPIQTEVRIANGNPVVRPTQLGFHSNTGSDRSVQGQDKPAPARYPENRLAFAEVGVAKLEQSNSARPSVFRLRGAPYSKSTSDLSPKKTCLYSKLEEDFNGELDGKLKRPSTLSLKGHNYSYTQRKMLAHANGTNSVGIFRRLPSNSLTSILSHKKQLPGNPKCLVKKPSNEECKVENISKEKIKSRVKTPVSLKEGRLSLYDDRLMSETSKLNCETEEYEPENGKLRRPSISLQQFKQVETNNNSEYLAADCPC